MPKQINTETGEGVHADDVRPGESWGQYIERLRKLPTVGAAQMSRIIAATVLMGKQPNAPANPRMTAALAQRVERHSSFRQLSRDPEALQMARRGKGAEMIVRMGEIKQQKDAMIRRYQRGQFQVRDDARFLKAASKSMRDSFSEQSPAQRERESKRFMEMMKHMDHARSLAEQGIPLDGKTARALAQAVQEYNDGGGKTPGGKQQAAASKEALCVLKRVMPAEEFDGYCASINQAHKAQDPRHRRHVEPNAYTEELLNGSARTARDLMLASQRQMNRGMTVDSCAAVTAIMQLSRGNPNAIVSKDALEREISGLKSPGSAFLRAMSDDAARGRYSQLAANGETAKLGKAILHDAKQHTIRSAQWQIDQASGAAAMDGKGASVDELAQILAAREMAAGAGPSQKLTNGAFKAKTEEIRSSPSFAALATQYEKDPGCRERINQGLSNGDGGKVLEQEYEKQKSPAALERQAEIPVLKRSAEDG